VLCIAGLFNFTRSFKLWSALVIPSIFFIIPSTTSISLRFKISTYTGQSLTEERRDFNVLELYSAVGIHLHTLRVPGALINAVSWEGSGLRIALAVQSHIYFASLRPDYKWAYLPNTLVYAFADTKSVESSVIFWNQLSHQKHKKRVKHLGLIRGLGEHCLLSSGEDQSKNCILTICNAIGVTLWNKIIEVRFFDLRPFMHLI